MYAKSEGKYKNSAFYFILQDPFRYLFQKKKKNKTAEISISQYSLSDHTTSLGHFWHKNDVQWAISRLVTSEHQDPDLPSLSPLEPPLVSSTFTPNSRDTEQWYM